MPALKNPRHEAFAQAYVRGEHAGNATAAHKAVYGVQAANGVAGWKMLKLVNVSARIAQIQDEIAHIDAQATDDAVKRLGLSKEWVLETLLKNANKGMKRDDGSTVNKAAELIGKHLGMFIASDAPNVNVNVGVQFVDHPPAETRQEWEARRRLELAPKANGRLELAPKANGKGHS
jgi:uncharacterized small protein (DUF1192 family)